MNRHGRGGLFSWPCQPRPEKFRKVLITGNEVTQINHGWKINDRLMTCQKHRGLLHHPPFVSTLQAQLLQRVRLDPKSRFDHFALRPGTHQVLVFKQHLHLKHGVHP